MTRRIAVARVAVAAALFVAGCTHTPPSTAPRLNPRAERALAADLTKIFAAPEMENGLWGVEVRSVDSGRVLFALNAHKLMMPASNMKILTLAAAAETLGWDYRFRTTLETSGEIQDGALKGDLVVVGGGDPTINSRDRRSEAVFDLWASALKAAGITRIDGNVIGDDTAFDATRLGKGWSWDYLQDGYAAPVGALEYDENVAALTVRPGAKPGDDAGLELTPGTGLGIVHRVVTGEAGSPTDIEVERPPSNPPFFVGGKPADAWIVVRGSIAVDAQPVSRPVAVANPALFFAQALTGALIARGIAIRGLPLERPDWRNAVAPLPRSVLAESLSPPLRDVATVMMKVSQNLYAETLLKAVGAAKGAGTADAGRTAARAIFSGWGIPDGSYVQADASGLSRYDLVTADMLVTILERLFCDPRHHDAFVATLPIAGKDGTISTRMKNTRAEGNAMAKTGSIANVRALSGYVRTQDGETLAFSILANSIAIPPATVNGIADQAVVRLADYTGR